jgi:hypothetical protein
MTTHVPCRSKVLDMYSRTQFGTTCRLVHNSKVDSCVSCMTEHGFRNYKRPAVSGLSDPALAAYHTINASLSSVGISTTCTSPGCRPDLGIDVPPLRAAALAAQPHAVCDYLHPFSRPSCPRANRSRVTATQVQALKQAEASRATSASLFENPGARAAPQIEKWRIAPPLAPHSTAPHRQGRGRDLDHCNVDHR